LQGLEKLVVVRVEDVDHLPGDRHGTVPVVEFASVLGVAVPDLMDEALCVGCVLWVWVEMGFGQGFAGRQTDQKRMGRQADRKRLRKGQGPLTSPHT